MLRSVFMVSAALAFMTAPALSASFPSPPLYPSFSSAKSKATISTFDPEDSKDVSVSGINSKGVITGEYVDRKSFIHGYERAANGTITTIDVPTVKTDSTDPNCINDGGEVAGYYLDNKSIVAHGFVLEAGGTFTKFDVPGDAIGADQGDTGTFPISINTDGVITGYYIDASRVYHGFVRTAGGKITQFDVSGAGTTGGLLQGTLALSVNASGVIAGFYRDSNSVGHSFVRSADGKITTFHVSGAGTAFGEGIGATLINDKGVVAGDYEDANFVTFGFVRATNGTITKFHIAGATKEGDGTRVSGIDAGGIIVGNYHLADGTSHGIVRAADGTITIFDVPGATGSSTTATSINSKGGIAGNYEDGKVTHGFVRNP